MELLLDGPQRPLRPSWGRLFKFKFALSGGALTGVGARPESTNWRDDSAIRKMAEAMQRLLDAGVLRAILPVMAAADGPPRRCLPLASIRTNQLGSPPARARLWRDVRWSLDQSAP